MLLPGAALAAVGLEGLHGHAQGQAGLAILAVGAVGEHATAPKALGDEFGIGAVVNQMAGRGDLRARLLAGQVAARVGRCCIKLHAVQGQVF